MALDGKDQMISYDAPKKDLYELGEIPPMGHVPKQMYFTQKGLVRIG